MMKQHRHIRRRLVGALAAFVVFCTTYALILPAVTLSSPVHCGKEEHTHTEDCYQSDDWLCGLEEAGAEGHVHDDSCYEEQEVLICQQEEGAEHVHDASCYEMQKVLTCQKEEGQSEGHVHTEECRRSETPLCGKEEHTHSRQCEFDPEAVETEEEWKKDFTNLKEEDLNKRILKIAESQLGYKESEKNFRVNEDGSEDGYTRYGDWAGEPYGDWNNAFTGFVLRYAGADAGWKKDAGEWIAAKADDLTQDKKEAEAGDVVFFRSGEGVLETGILKKKGDITWSVVAGNQDRQVKAVEVAESSVAGVVSCEKRTAAEEPEQKEEETAENTLSQIARDIDETVEVTAKYTEKAEIPEGYELRATFLEALEDGTKKYDVGFYAGEEEYEPKAPVQISVKFLDGSFQDASALDIQHYKKDGSVETVSNSMAEDEEGNRTSEFALDSFSPITFAAGAEDETGQEFTIVYNINTGGIKPDSGSDIYPVPLIQDKTTYKETVMVGSDGYIVLSPNVNEIGAGVNRTDNGKTTNNYSRNMYRFTGWNVSGQKDTTLESGKPISPQDLQKYVKKGTITLNANWEPLNKVGTVNFYVSLTLNTPDDYAVSGNTEVGSFLPKAVYSSGVTVETNDTSLQNMNTQAIFLGYYSQNYGNVTANTVDSVHRSITSLVNEKKEYTSLPSAKSAGNNTQYSSGIKASFQLSSLPDDAVILNEVKKQVLAGNNILDSSGESVITANEVNDLIPENYTIKWYVFKSHSNGWHIDGCLQKNPGKLTVTKTFYGDQDAISSVKDQYSITLNNVNGKTVETLVLNSESPGTAPTSVSTNNAQATTYRWVLTLDAGSKYTLKEKNYVADKNTGEGNMATIPQYNVVGADSESKPLSQYSNSGVEVTVKSYSPNTPDTDYQTVNYFNGYFPENYFLIEKTDELGNLLPGAGFQMFKDKTRVEVYRKVSEPDVYYLFAKGEETEEYERVQDDLITIGGSGYAAVVGLKDQSHYGEYLMKETVVPTGYANIGEFTITTSKGGITVNDSSGFATVQEDRTLIVKNTSQKTNIEVNKVWGDGESSATSVTVQLMRNGIPVGEPVDLNSAKNWKHTWKDMPIYAGVSRADYSVREIKIGDLAYNEVVDPSDGYRDYMVTTNKSEDESGVHITVTNRLDKRRVMFEKTDEGKSVKLSGAQFQLYKDSGCAVAYGQPVTSGEDGIVDFGNLANGTYYLQEITAPEGYELSTQVYVIKVSDNGNSIQKLGEYDKGDGTDINQITNTQEKAFIKLIKQDENGKGISGAVFSLKYPDGSIKTIDFGTNSEVTISNLVMGQYELTETKAPAGYNLLTKCLTFEIKNGKPQQATLEQTQGFAVDSEAGTITIRNTTGRELPNTGGSGTQLLTSAGAAMIAGSLLMYGYKMRLRGKERRTK